MTKKILALIGGIFFLIGLTVNTHAHNTTSEEHGHDITQLEVSPAIILVEETDLGTSYDITLTNTGDTTLIIQPILRFVDKDRSADQPVLDIDPEGEFLEFDEQEITLAAKSSTTFKARVRLDLPEIMAYPAIAFRLEQTESEPVSELFTIFLIQEPDSQIGIDTTVTLDQKGLVLTQQMTITGTVINNGSKFFDPTGVLKVYKGQELVFEQDFSSQISGLLFPGEQRSFELAWKNDDTSLAAIGSYQLVTEIKPNHFNNTFTTKVSYVYLPQDLALIAGISFIAITFIGAGILVINGRKRS